MYQPQYARALTVRDPRLISSAPPESVSKTVFSSSSESRLWSTYISLTVSPTTTEPLSGSSTPVIILKSVVFPAPLAPTIPTTAPGGTMQSNPSINSPRPSYPLDRPLTSTTTSPSLGAAGMVMESRSARAVNLVASSQSSSYALSRALPFFCWPLAFFRTHSSSALMVRDSASCFFCSDARRLDLDSSHVL